MSWSIRGLRDARVEFVMIAREADANVSAACRNFGISRKTGYKWLHRYETAGLNGLVDQSRRPHSSPLQIEAANVAPRPWLSCHASMRTGTEETTGTLIERRRVP